MAGSVRVIAGSLKGRQLKPPTWQGLRPTSDKLRETLFNVLAPRIAGAQVLDGYAGTGAVGIEALSRGAEHVTFIEQDARAQALIGDNLARRGLESGYTMVRATMARGVKMLRNGAAPVRFDLILLDPPYGHQLAEALADLDGLLAPDGLVVLEHARRQVPPETVVGGLVRGRLLTSGDSSLSFYTCQP